MKKSLCKPISFIPLLLLFVSVVYSTLASKKQDIKVAEPLSYKRIYSDSKGESHFANEEILFKLPVPDFETPPPPVSVSDAINVEAVVFISSPSGRLGNWQPAPRRQFIFVISGELEVEVSDGETCRFGSGSIILVDDAKGYISWVVSKERGYAIAVSLK